MRIAFRSSAARSARKSTRPEFHKPCPAPSLPTFCRVSPLPSLPRARIHLFSRQILRESLSRARTRAPRPAVLRASPAHAPPREPDTNMRLATAAYTVLHPSPSSINSYTHSPNHPVTLTRLTPPQGRANIIYINPARHAPIDRYTFTFSSRLTSYRSLRTRGETNGVRLEGDGLRARGASVRALLRWWRAGDGEDRRRPGGDVGRRPGERLTGRAGDDAVARPHLRLGMEVQEHVPVRARRPADQARRQQLRRHGHHMLLHVGRGVGHPRRGGPGVPGQRHRPAVHAAHQRLRQRHRRQRAAVPPLVRPHHRLPHLLHRLDLAAHPCAGGRDADQGDEEPRGQGDRLPVVAADAAVREPVERRRLGHAGRARQDGLVAGAVRRAVPQLHRRGRRVVVVAGRLRPGDGRDGAAGDEVGAQQLHGLRLLRGQQAVPAGLPARVLHAVEWSGDAPKPRCTLMNADSIEHT